MSYRYKYYKYKRLYLELKQKMLNDMQYGNANNDTNEQKTDSYALSKFNYLIEKGIEEGKSPKISDACVYDTVWSHDQVGLNYEWLWPYYGRLLWVDYREPSKTGQWRTYNRYWWARHAAVVSHNPDNLVEEHVKWYVDLNGRCETARRLTGAAT